jgi:hypothetical protein
MPADKSSSNRCSPLCRTRSGRGHPTGRDARSAGPAAAVDRCHVRQTLASVPSQRFEMDTCIDPIDVYRILRITNPSRTYLQHVPNGQGAIDFSHFRIQAGALVTLRDRWVTRSVSVGNRDFRDRKERRGGQLMVDRAGGHALTGGWFEPGLSAGPGSRWWRWIGSAVAGRCDGWVRSENFPGKQVEVWQKLGHRAANSLLSLAANSSR